MDEAEFSEALRGCQEKEESFFENHRYYLAWLITHIYANNPYLKKGTRVKIEDLIKLKGGNKEEIKEITAEERMAKMDEVFAKWDRMKEKKAQKT